MRALLGQLAILIKAQRSVSLFVHEVTSLKLKAEDEHFENTLNNQLALIFLGAHSNRPRT